ncbi:MULTISPECIES: N-acetyl-gamma-glutamyl-phosphate reductase [Vibrio]|jgi:N-acetyl-gamma-glutamyl-phosphate reductase|uniref:N-acetyl-gamma-glutamyl-phosphate reductase n=3 Tax=Vibrio cyclitrophicus TaxID=47951 RepID=A0A7Z1S483_9VIBR|nr:MULTISPECIES: N-acetyl-gamma-glutamyl-phosphate reductase [Vibrio]KAA8598370.1 N-acetyl-gamma-glutamyl-phosphate reductase [Vibrio cyclitrophicus]MBU2931116.1 N-acetyl-gamma-glutamyl-phosphate reductase [Vibrio cyclitrophicus]MCC4773368.1 N-acetyl-gamma-glutamyl-phosphate reductase [Vibrio cyclitrophicus]MCC4842482.1 N-acetyl-gamma-glutamyl-phosphate reductase [Vibrio cyclitrophicus]MDH5879624.1 N-acetyl-gamma-glutamyl-phosphate reductase [Vibrio sp. S/42/10]
MLKTTIIGASGYTGAELALMINRHPELTLSGLYVSANSVDAGKPIAALHGKLAGLIDMPVQPLTNPEEVAKQSDVIFLATAHEVSHDLAPIFLENGCQVFDLSGAFRVKGENFYEEFYGFEHQHEQWLDKAAYGLAEWNEQEIKEAQLVAVAGCYPTASQLAIKPLVEAKLLDTNQWPVINATSGVTGAGRKASMVNSFCEVSLQAYGVFNHRHQPEMAAHLGCDVIFTPHLGNFKRGILATITMKLAEGVTEKQIQEAFEKAYQGKPAVRLLEETLPRIQDVEQTPFCDLGWKVQGQHIIVVSAIDNLLKGASSQAMQCLNLRYGFAPLTALV